MGEALTCWLLPFFPTNKGAPEVYGREASLLGSVQQGAFNRKTKEDLSPPPILPRQAQPFQERETTLPILLIK